MNLNSSTDSASRIHLARSWSQDALASIVVFLVALPLCMGIAIASGTPASTGLLAGVIGGIVVGWLGGCPLQVSGPAAGLTTVMYSAVLQHGLERLGLIVFVAGLMQLLAAWLRLGDWFRAVSPAVIRGMLGGIGILIVASQFHVMLDDVPNGSGLQDLTTIPQAIQKAFHVPQIPSRDIRHESRDILQRVGELHRQQINLNELVAETVPHHRQRSLIEDGVDLQQFLPEQEQIQVELQAILESCASEFAEQPERVRKINEFGRQALQAQDLALVDLRENRWTLIIPAQVEAAESLADLQIAFKNHELAAGVGVLTILALISWQSLAWGPFKVVPATLVAILVATLAASIWQLPILYVEVPSSLFDEIHYLRWSVILDAEWGGVLSTAAIIAALASAQTLLTATAIDQLHHGERTNYGRELFAQGIGNCCCGFIGALPLAGVIVRSTANIDAGAKTRLSAILHGVWMLVFIVALGAFLRMIPTSALAAILVYTGYKLVDWKSARELSRYGTGELAVYLVTVGTVVAVDLLMGVIAGFGLALVLLAYRSSRLRVRVERQDEGDRYRVRLDGAATFLKLPKLARALERIPNGSHVELDLSHLRDIDHASVQLLESWISQQEGEGGTVVIDRSLLRGRSKGRPAVRESEETVTR